jgi:hypothetical protein
LSDLEEEDEDEERSEATTQQNFRETKKSVKASAAEVAAEEKKKKDIDEEARATQLSALAAVSEEKLEKLQAGFTKQLEAMQTLLTQQVDTKLSTLTDNIISDRKEDKNTTESEINSLKADVQTLQSQLKRNVSSMQHEPPTPRMQRQVSTNSVTGLIAQSPGLGPGAGAISKAAEQLINSTLRRLEDQFNTLERDLNRMKMEKAKQNAVDIVQVQKNLEAKIAHQHEATAEALKRSLQLETQTKALQTEISGMAQDFKQKVQKVGANVIRIGNVKEETKARLDQF